MQRQLMRIGLGILLITSVLSCGKVQEPRIVEIVSTQIKKFSANSLEIAVILKIDNPNNFNILITGSDLDISLNDNQIGKASIVDKLKIPKNAIEDQSITLKIQDTKLLANVFPALLIASFSGGVKLDAKGFIKARVRGFSKKIPIEFSQVQ